jgi:RNA recognition motif-containing protein
MNETLYVGNLSYSTNGDTLRDHFSAAGQVVSASVISDRETGRSRGFGFVQMTTAEEAQKAIEMFDGQDFEGRPLRVNVAKPKTDRAPRGEDRW